MIRSEGDDTVSQLHVTSPCGQQLGYKIEHRMAVTDLKLARSLVNWPRFRATCQRVGIEPTADFKANQLKVELPTNPRGGQITVFKIFGMLFDAFAGIEHNAEELSKMVKGQATALVGSPA